jgi:phage anti-repressor protein
VGEVQLEALKLFHTVTSSGFDSDSDFLSKLCSEEIFIMLLENILECDEQISNENSNLENDNVSKPTVKKDTSKQIIQTLVFKTGICLQSGEDFELLLALLGSRKEKLTYISTILHQAVKEIHSTRDNLLSLSFAQMRIRSQTEGLGLDADELFKSLLDPDFNEEMVTGFIPKEVSETYFSPLILTLTNNITEGSDFVELFLKLIAFLFEDVDIFCSLLEDLDANFTTNFKKWVKAPFVEVSDDLVPVKESWILLKIESCRLLHLSCKNVEHCARLSELVQSPSPSLQTGLVRSLLARKGLTEEFSPFGSNCSSMVAVKLLKLAKPLGVFCESIKNKFLSQIKYFLVNSKQVPNADGLLVTECFHHLQFNFDDLYTLFNELVGYSVSDFLSSGSEELHIPRIILSGACHAMSTLDSKQLEDDRFQPLLERLSCLIEVLLDACTDLGDMAKSLKNILAVRPDLCEKSISENLVHVCLNKENCGEFGVEYILLASTLITTSKKHLDAFKSWVLEDKTRVSERLWPLLPKVFENPGFQNEKKFITILLKNVIVQIQNLLSNPKEGDYDLLIDITRHLCTFSKSEKQLELWTKCVADISDNIEECLDLFPSLLRIKYLILSTIHKISGGLDGRLMKEAFLPLMHQIGLGLKSSTESETMLVIDLCNAASECKDLIENKAFVKEIGKNSTVWEKFYRNVLKYSLKIETSNKVASLQLLSSVCGFLMAGGKLSNPDTIVDMVQSHSQYLTILLGPPSNLKTNLLELLLTLVPSSCRLEQVPLMLSGYTATLHPSDRALLSLLHQYEVQGLDLAQYQPFMFGPPALTHYSPTGGWKTPKASELLKLLNSEQMCQTSINFPLFLPLDPMEEIQDDGSLSSEQYDPRFLLPFLSHLLDSNCNIFMDKHMRLVDGGALSFAIAAISSAVYGVRAAGYHLLQSIYRSLSSAKLAKEKKVWLHLIMLIKQGLATSPRWSTDRKCVRLPSLLTVFLIKTVNVLLDPEDPLYRPVCRSILAKPALDLSAIPEFSRLLNSADASNSKAEQRWLLDLVKAGVKDNIDYDLVKRNYATKILMALWGSCLLDRAGHLLVLDVITNCVRTNYGCLDLVTKQGLLPWLTVVVKNMNLDKAFVKKIVNIFDSILKTVREYDKRNEEQGQEKKKVEESINLELQVLFKSLQIFFKNKSDENQLKLLSEIFS